MNDTQGTAPAIAGDPITQNLAGAFAALDVDNTAAPVEEPVVEEPKVETPEEPTEEPPAPEEKPEDEKGEEGDTPDEPEASVDEDYYPESADELKAKWPRAVPLHVIEQANQWAQEAKEGAEIKAKIGEAFIEPVSKMVEAMRSDDDDPNSYVPFMEGVVDAAGESGLAKVISHSLYVGLVKAKDWIANPETAEFGKELNRRADAFLEMRFGLPADRIEKATDWDKDGSLDKIIALLESEYKDEDGDFDEIKLLDAAKVLYNEVRSIRNDPVKKKLAEENAALRRQPEKPIQVEERADESEFVDYLGTVCDRVLTEIIPKNSPLIELKDDSDEIKETKQTLRDQLADKMRFTLQKSKSRVPLLDGYKKGQQRTSVYQDKLVNAFATEVVPVINAERLRAEKLIAAAYGKTRNAQLAKKATPPSPPPPAQEPTVPTNFQPAQTRPTTAQIDKRLSDAFANLG